jgi:hypothetical protein
MDNETGQVARETVVAIWATPVGKGIHMQRFYPRVIGLALVLLALASQVHSATPASGPASQPASQPAKDDPRTKLEATLMTLPSSKAEQWLLAWHGQIVMAAAWDTIPRPLGGPPSPGPITMLTIENRSPCVLTVSGISTISALRLGGAAKSPLLGKAEELTIAPGKKVMVAKAPEIAGLALNGDFGNRPMLAYAYGPLCKIKVLPSKTTLEPFTFDVQFELGYTERQVVGAGYLLSAGDNSDHQIAEKRLGH